MTPLLLLDLDGVLNPFAAATCPDGFDEYHFFAGEEPVRLRASDGIWINELAASFEIVWATGWGEDANAFICPVLGIPPLPVEAFPATPFDPAEKVPAIDRFVGQRSVAWVDDILTPEAQAWADRRTAPTLLVATDPAIGLTERIVLELRQWAATVHRTE